MRRQCSESCYHTRGYFSTSEVQPQKQGRRLPMPNDSDTSCGCFKPPRPNALILAMFWVTACAAGLYIQAVSSSISPVSGQEGSGISAIHPRRLFFKQQKSAPMEVKNQLSSTWWSRNNDRVAENNSLQTLVLYIFSNTDPEYIDNLRFYVRNAIYEGDGCHHVIVINSGPAAQLIDDMPELPPNAKYLHHANECYDWGTFGWALEQEQVQVNDYKYFIMLNSSVRGPFLPPYVQGKMHFSKLMTNKLDPDDAQNATKMVGPSINCKTVSGPGGMKRSNPHVQSFAVATDQTGMQLLIDDGKVFGCYTDIDETIYHSELGSSDAILRAGYNIASFMSRYQGVNWLDESTWNCNDGENPFNWGAMDIYSLQPMELMFVKVKHWALMNGYPSMIEAVQYDEWNSAAARGEQDVGRHKLKENEMESKAARILKLAARGPQCWDCDFYKEQNEDLAALPCHDAYVHFVNNGQFEPTRPFRWVCETDWEERGILPFRPKSAGGNTTTWPLLGPASCEEEPNMLIATTAPEDGGTEAQEQPEATPDEPMVVEDQPETLQQTTPDEPVVVEYQPETVQQAAPDITGAEVQQEMQADTTDEPALQADPVATGAEEKQDEPKADATTAAEEKADKAPDSQPQATVAAKDQPESSLATTEVPSTPTASAAQPIGTK